MEFEIEGTLKYATSNYQLTISEPIHITGDEGKVIAIIGENGSGKTTLIRAILEDPVVNLEGNISLTYGGKKPRIVFTPQVAEVEKPLTMRDYIGFQERMEKVVEELGIPLDLTTNNVSSGTLRKAQILKKLLSEGDVYILDEPISHVDRAAQRTFANIINDGKAMGKWFFISGNEPYFLGEVATDIVYMVVTPENKATASSIVITPLPGQSGLTLRQLARYHCQYLTQHLYKKKRVKMKRIMFDLEVPDVV